MKNLMYKELKLGIPVGVYLFLLMAVMFLIPAYPYAVPLMYFAFPIQIIFATISEKKDLEFIAALPVKRNDIVKSKIFVAVFMQMLFAVCCIPFAIISTTVINSAGNPVGTDANFALFGYALICYTIFNFVFITGYFKTGHKWGIPFVLALLISIVAFVILEVITAVVPVFNTYLDSLNPAYFGYQAIVLVLGIALYIGGLILTYKKAVKNFDKVSL